MLLPSGTQTFEGGLITGAGIVQLSGGTLSAFAYMFLERLRAWGLCGRTLERATLGSVRLRLLKVAAQVTVSVRRVYVQLCSAFPLQRLFAQCQQRLAAVESS